MWILNILVFLGLGFTITGLALWANNKKPIVKFVAIVIFLAIIQITVLIMATQIEWIVLEE